MVIAITGGARGIGQATAAVLAAGGARVAIGDVDEAAARDTAQRLGIAGYGLDVTDPGSVGAFVDAVERDIGPLAVFVNNAGVLAAGPVAEESDQATRRTIDVNLVGTITGTKAALRVMLPRRRGHIVNVASISGESYGGGEASYCASKYGVVGYTDAARFELRGSGVRFTLVMPTLVATDLTSGVGDLRWLRSLRKVPPGEVAAAIAGAVRRPRRRVYVPAGAGVFMALRRITPTPLNEALAAAIGARSIFLDVDRPARQAYEASRRVTDPAAE